MPCLTCNICTTHFSPERSGSLIRFPMVKLSASCCPAVKWACRSCISVKSLLLDHRHPRHEDPLEESYQGGRGPDRTRSDMVGRNCLSSLSSAEWHQTAAGRVCCCCRAASSLKHHCATKEWSRPIRKSIDVCLNVLRSVSCDIAR